MLRPTPRAAVVARPIVPTLTAFRPRNAPSSVAPIDSAVCTFWSDACCCFTADRLFRASEPIGERRQLRRVLLPHGIDRRVPGGARLRSAAGRESPAPIRRASTRRPASDGATAQPARSAPAIARTPSPRRRISAAAPRLPAASRTPGLPLPACRQRSVTANSSFRDCGPVHLDRIICYRHEIENVLDGIHAERPIGETDARRTDDARRDTRARPAAPPGPAGRIPECLEERPGGRDGASGDVRLRDVAARRWQRRCRACRPARPSGTRGSAGAVLSALICSRDSGPRRYDSVHRVWNTVGSVSCTLCIRNTRFSSAESSRSALGAIEPAAAPFQPVEHARLVPLGLQPAEEPGAGVAPAPCSRGRRGSASPARRPGRTPVPA